MWWWVAACVAPSSPTTDDGTTPTPTDGFPVDSGTWRHTGVHSGTTASPTGETGGAHTAETGGPDVCASPPPSSFTSSSMLGQVPTGEEFAFDTSGNVYTAVEGSGIFRTPYSGAPSLLNPYHSFELAGIRVTPDGGSVAVCDEAAGRIVAIDLQTGGQTVLASGLPSPNSIGFDLRGWLYVASYGQVTRYRGGGARAEVLIDEPFADFDGVAFAPDDSAVYVNVDDRGDIWRIALDAAGELLGASQVLHLPLNPGQSLDGMTTDTCGNLYVVDTDGRLRRVDVDHRIETLLPTSGRYTTAVSFGSGFGGFERDHLYVMDRSSGLLDLALGIEGRREPHYPP